MNRTTVEQIKERLPIETVIAQYVKLEKAGKSLKARCPFHNEKTASFFVSPDRGGYYCFGCGAKGDVFSFVEQFEGLDFKGALKLLAERAGVPLVFDQKADSEKDRIFQLMEDSAKFFEVQFERSKEAKEYIKSRGITDKTRTEFRIGWAPEGWQNLIAHLRKNKWPDGLIEKAGLGKKTDDGKFYDRFRGRVMFPVTDSSGRVIAYSGRILKDDGKSAKYINNPDTPLYDKSLVLYGLDKAKSEIRRMGYSILVEGQMDLVMSHQAGIKNTVAASGTALTDESFSQNGAVSNLGLVRRLSPNIIIAFDSDSAGRKAAMRAAGIALGMGMDVKIADLVGGKDPADLVKESVELWKSALKDAKPIVEFELMNVLRDTPDPRKTARALRERVFPFLARIESEMDKSHFVKMIAERAKIADNAIWQDLRSVEKAIKAGGASKTFSASPVNSAGLNAVSRLDLVERRLFGLLKSMENAKTTEAESFRNEIKKIAGGSYADRLKQIEPIMNDLIFEAEAIYGTTPSDQADWSKHMKELMVNFEEDLVSEELILAMQELKSAERAGQPEKVMELAKKCQELSSRKAEVGKRRRDS